jgi:hypothetical protein
VRPTAPAQQSALLFTLAEPWSRLQPTQRVAAFSVCAHSQATSLHQQFLATFGLHAAEFPLMHLSLTAGFRPG